MIDELVRATNEGESQTAMSKLSTNKASLTLRVA